MKYKVKYIDDESEDRSKAYADGLSTLGLLDIQVITPTKFEVLISELIYDQANIDALILDLKLDGNQSGDRTASYTAPSLASGIRSKCFTEDGFKKEFPIFLISSSENLEKYYDPDSSSHDLFDSTFTKISVGEYGSQYESLISSFIDAYNIIKGDKTNFEAILKSENILEIHNGIFSSRFLSGESTSVSEIAQFIHNELLIKSGILIDEIVLSSRLGINRLDSKEWSKLLGLLSESEYKGVFSSTSIRWWSKDILKWWKNNFDDYPLIRLEASDRVEMIKRKFNLNDLIPAEKIPKTTSTKFWTICQALKLPLDPKDGFLVDGNYFPWQDKKYVSLEALLERITIKQNLRLHPSEQERFKEIKKGFE